MSYDRFMMMINNLDLLRKQSYDKKDFHERIDKFIKEFGLLDFRTFPEEPVQTA